MIRWTLLVLAVVACADPLHMPAKPPHAVASAAKPPSPAPPPPPPPPDNSYAPVPQEIATVLSDPEARIEVFVLDSMQAKSGYFGDFPVVRHEVLHGIERDRVATLLTSSVTYGHLSGMCSSPGLGFHLESSKRGMLDLRVDAPEGSVELLGTNPQKGYSLSMTGINLFLDLEKRLAGKAGCR